MPNLARCVIILQHQGVSFEQKLVEVDEEYRALYDKAVDLWFETWVYLNSLKETTGLLLPWKARHFALQPSLIVCTHAIRQA
jgi:hypothetical protein